MFAKIICLFLLFVATNSFGFEPTSKRLKEDLLANYSTLVRPVLNVSKPIHVWIELNLRQILKVDTKNQQITWMFWVTEYWTDNFLGWKPADYDGIDEIHLPSTLIWVPDTHITESVDLNSAKTSLRDAMPVKVKPVLNRGPVTALVTLMYPQTVTTSCAMETVDFPWDIQTCNFSVRSWTHHREQIKYFSRDMDWKNMMESSEWHLEAYRILSNRNNCFDLHMPVLPKEYQCWSAVIYTARIGRKWAYYFYTLILPTELLVQISLIGLFSLSASTSDRSEKVTIGLISLLVLCILMVLVGDAMPAIGIQIPKIYIHFGIQLLTVSLAILISTILIYMQLYGNKGMPIPGTLRRLFLKKKRKIAATDESDLNQKCNQPFQCGHESLQRQSEVVLGNIKKNVAGIYKALRKLDEQSEHTEEWSKLIIRMEVTFFILFSAFNVFDALCFIYSKGLY